MLFYDWIGIAFSAVLLVLAIISSCLAGSMRANTNDIIIDYYMQQLYGVNIVIETLKGNANTQITRGDMIVPAVICGNFGMETILRMGENGQRGRRCRCARIGHDLTNERRIFQRLRVNKLPVHDPAFCQFLPNLLGIDVIEGVFFHIRCGTSDLGCMGMVAPHFFRSIFQRVKWAVNIAVTQHPILAHLGALRGNQVG